MTDAMKSPTAGDGPRTSKGRAYSDVVVATLFALLLLVAATAAGCGFAKAKEDAQEAIAAHFQAVAQHAPNVVMSGYDEKFFKSVPREEWEKRLALAETKLGEFRSFEIVNWNVNSKIGTDSGTHVSLTCKVTYSKYSAQEAFVLFRAHDDEPFRIVKHGINSDAFLAE